ncbi:hypothetical protein H0H87_002309 [Tephrocybe sp. NHM501043]|nr:hypothetical protein H0H87_002309 [Tephrocybe sp. NHM501043]
MPLVHKILFGSSIVMFLIAGAHLDLLIQQVTKPIVPQANFQMQIILSAFVGHYMPSSRSDSRDLFLSDQALTAQLPGLKLTSLALAQTKSSGLPILLNMEVPLIVRTNVFAQALLLTLQFHKGILPTLIIVFMHFKRLPGTKTAAADYGQRHQRPEPPPLARVVLRDDLAPHTRTTNVSESSNNGGEPEDKDEVKHIEGRRDIKPEQDRIEDIRDVADIV